MKIHLPSISKQRVIRVTLIAGTSFIITMTVISLGLIQINQFFEKYYFSFQSPIYFQQPMTIHNRTKELVSPVPREKIIEEQIEVKEATQEARKAESKSVQLAQNTKRTSGCIEKRPDVAEKLRIVFGEEGNHAIELFCRESSLNPEAVNPSSGACGLVQALPCKKLLDVCPDMDIDCQINWGKNYINKRYGTAQKAVAWHDEKNWY